MLLSEAFDAYIQHYVIPYQSGGTVRVFQRAKLSICKTDKPLDELTTKDVLNWQNKLLNSCSPNTVRLYTEKLRKVLAYNQSLGNTCLSPQLVHSPKPNITAVEWLTPCEVKLFIDEALKKRHGRSKVGRYRNAAIIALLYSTGLRVHELTKLDRDSIINQKSITITGKGGKQGIVFVDKRSLYLISEYLELRTDTNRALFVTLDGNRLCTDKIREVFTCLSRYYPKKVHPHMLRHSYATNLLENGCHPFTMQRLMRHSTFLSTQKYLHIVNKELEEAYEKYHN